MHECCGNEERESTFGQIFSKIISGDYLVAASTAYETKTIIYQTLIILAFFILIAYSFLKESPVVRKTETDIMKKED